MPGLGGLPEPHLQYYWRPCGARATRLKLSPSPFHRCPREQGDVPDAHPNCDWRHRDQRRRAPVSPDWVCGLPAGNGGARTQECCAGECVSCARGRLQACVYVYVHRAVAACLLAAVARALKSVVQVSCRGQRFAWGGQGQRGNGACTILYAVRRWLPVLLSYPSIQTYMYRHSPLRQCS